MIGVICEKCHAAAFLPMNERGHMVQSKLIFLGAFFSLVFVSVQISRFLECGNTANLCPCLVNRADM